MYVNFDFVRGGNRYSRTGWSSPQSLSNHAIDLHVGDMVSMRVSTNNPEHSAGPEFLIDEGACCQCSETAGGELTIRALAPGQSIIHVQNGQERLFSLSITVLG